MANEARVTSSLQIVKTSGTLVLLDYTSGRSGFQATVTGTKGPVPGALTVDVTGEDVLFAELSQPGLCRIKNLDPTNFVEVGIHDGVLFHPFMELLPGESYVIRLSRFMGEEHTEPGTATSGVVNFFYVRANTASCNVLVECFET